MPFLRPYVRADIRGATATLRQDLVYDGRDQTFTVPTGFPTDFASVPQIVTWLVPTMGAYTEAAVLHDWLCTELEDHRALRRRYYSGDRISQAEFEKIDTSLAPATARDTDGIFRRVMREEGVGLVRRWLMWTAVRWGALTNPARRPGWWSTAPAVLGISVLALPVIAPAAILAAVTLAVDVLVEALVGRWWR